MLSTTGGCDTVATLNLVVTSLLTDTTNAVVCANQLPYIWHGNPYSLAGTYTDTLVNTSGGCDTAAVLNLTINPLLTSTTNAQVCTNQLPYIWNGNPYSLGGTYVDTLLSTTGGCDTVATLNLVITSLLTDTTNASVCANQLPYIWHGNPYSLAGTYTDTLVNTSGGCDTAAVLNLTINPLLTSTTNAQVCTNQLPYIWNGNPYSSGGTYVDTLLNTTGGCDTIATLNLVINALVTDMTNTTVCANQLPYIWHGNPYSIAGTYLDTLINTTGGCDTAAVLNLTINPLLTSTTNAQVCTNQLPYIWNGNPYSSGGTYVDTLLSTTGGCDTAATLNLVISALIADTTNAVVCANQLPYIWHGNPYSIAGTYLDTLINTSGGCDTAAVLNLTINPLFTSTTNAQVCANQLPYIWNGNPYSLGGTYVDTLPSITGGCDTVATLNLVVTSLLTDTTNAVVCANQLPYIWHGNIYNIAGTYTDTLFNTSGGCDTAAVLNLTINPLPTSVTNASVCANQLPYIWNGNPYSVAGTYLDTIPGPVGGCDTAATLNLVINPLPTSVTNASVCANQLPYIWNGNPYSVAGTYLDTIPGPVGGCDTAATLNLVINPLPTSVTNASVCANQLPYIWNGNPYSVAGTYLDTIPGPVGGCDTSATLNLVINPLPTSVTNASVCANQLPYIWNGNPYSVAGTYLDTIPGVPGGCDTAATLNLVIKPLTNSSTPVTICNNLLPYTWNGNTYNTAGTYSVILVGSNGCDSTATLVLTVSQTSTSITNISICANQLPYNWNGNNYNNTGFYVVHLVNAAGCDSAATLNLNVRPVSGSTQTISTCAASFTLPDGTVVNTSGTYTSILVNTAGCDSTIVTQLTLFAAPQLVITDPAAVCTPSTVNLTAPAVTAGSGAGLVFTYWLDPAATLPLANPAAVNLSGTYYIKATNANGCIKIDSVHARINVTPTAFLSGAQTVCAGNNLQLSVNLTGTAPFSFSWTDGTNIQTVSPVNASPYILNLTPSANILYGITAVSDANCSATGVLSALAVTVVPVTPGIRYPPLATRAFQPLQLSARNLGPGYTYTWAPPVGLNSYSSITPVFNYDRPTVYTISIASPAGCLTVDTLQVRIIPEPIPAPVEEIFVPKAWTPNNDGHNDKLRPLLENIRELKFFRIYNRWGQLVYETNKAGEGWDGIFKGQPQVMDTYTWVAEGVGVTGTVIKRSGNSLLMR
ncbi:MAG: gliding motility-associated C-terminal domain-containing protein [Chitinophagaceae bacterium]|nr:gliding motility-associated C-terminal domain-containing protein [Chitinophagaceae bacterium]